MLTRNLPSVMILPFVFAAVLGLSPGTLHADGLPPEAKKVVEAFEKETAGIRKKGDDRTSAAQDKLLKKLRELQVEQTKAGMLDEAVLIRDSVRALEAAKLEARHSQFAAKVVAKLPAEAQVAIRECDESVGEIAKGVADDLNAKRAAYNAKLKELLATYTGEGKLDEALAVRSRISSSPMAYAATADAAKSGIAAGLGNAGTDYATVERRYREQLAQRHLESRKAHKRIADGLVLKLAEILAAHTKAGRLDPAVAIRNFSQGLVAEQDPSRMVELARANRVKLPVDAASLIDGFLEEATGLQTQSAESLTKLNGELAPHVEVEARRQLIAGNVEPSRQLLNQLFGFRKQEFPFAWAGHYRMAPVLNEQAQPIFDRFAKAKAERLAKADVEQEPLRKKLVETLQAALDAQPKADATEALEQTVKLLGSDSTEGVRGMLPFVIDNRLPEASLAAVKEFRNAVKKLTLELNAQNAEAAKQFAVELVPVREVLVVAGEFEAAFVVLERQQNAHRSFAPFAVKTSPAAGHPLLWDGSVVDAKDGLYLVIYTHREEWLSRDRFRVGNETAAINVQLGGSVEQRAVTRPGFGTPKEGPGQPVTEKTKLKVGQRLMAYWGSRWLLVTVIEVGETGVKIHWEGYPSGSDEVIDRARLRDVSDD